ncbi:MAG: hypothetical protein WB444_03460, partial [Gallionella sp.]
ELVPRPLTTAKDGDGDPGGGYRLIAAIAKKKPRLTTLAEWPAGAWITAANGGPQLSRKGRQPVSFSGGSTRCVG